MLILDTVVLEGERDHTEERGKNRDADFTIPKTPKTEVDENGGREGG